MVALTGIPNEMEAAILALGLGKFAIIAIYLVIIVLMGTILDSGSIMLITIPIIVPALGPFDIDLIWLGIITIIAVEIGLLTPPFGVACFVIQSNLEDQNIKLNDIFIGALPYAVTMLFVLVLVTAFPGIALVLVN
jgi:TRAP-type C4-dicarboxylate transport system permease large subunit